MPGIGDRPPEPSACRRLHPRTGHGRNACRMAGWRSPSLRRGMPMAQKHESRHEIDQLEDEWRMPCSAPTPRVMDSLLAADYMGITASGTLQSRDETLLSLVPAGCTSRSSKYPTGRCAFTGHSRGHVAGQHPGDHPEWKDRPATIATRTCTCANAQGDWKIVSFEASRVREPGPQKRNEFHAAK